MTPDDLLGLLDDIDNGPELDAEMADFVNRMLKLCESGKMPTEAQLSLILDLAERSTHG